MENQVHNWNEEYESGEYKKLWNYEHPSQELVSFIAAQNIPEKGTVVDVGCGAGKEAIFMASCGYKTVGLDISEKAIEIAREAAVDAGVEVDFNVSDASELPLESGSVDFVNDRGLFHILKDEDRQRFCTEIQRVLKSGGKMLFRGCRMSFEGDPFSEVNRETVDEHFPTNSFSRGPILPIEIISDEKKLPAHLVVLSKR